MSPGYEPVPSLNQVSRAVGSAILLHLMHKQKGPVGLESSGPFIPTKESSTKSCAAPKCAACLLAKQHWHGAGSEHTHKDQHKDMAICCDATKPGSHVSTDQWVSKIPG